MNSTAQVIQLNRQDNNMTAEENKPAPFVPRDCDLSDMSYMPVDIAKFTRSRALAIMPPEYALPHITLWMESWHRTPCGSLPDDDFELAQLAGYGRDIHGFTEGKEHIMSKWTLCDDGRYYHKTIAARALETWVEKLAYKIRSAKGNAARNKTEFNPIELFEKLGESVQMLRRANPNAKRIMTGFPEKHLSEFDNFLEGSIYSPSRKAYAAVEGDNSVVNAPNINSKSNINGKSKGAPEMPLSEVDVECLFMPMLFQKNWLQDERIKASLRTTLEEYEVKPTTLIWKLVSEKFFNYHTENAVKKTNWLAVFSDWARTDVDKNAWRWKKDQEASGASVSSKLTVPKFDYDGASSLQNWATGNGFREAKQGESVRAYHDALTKLAAERSTS